MNEIDRIIEKREAEVRQIFKDAMLQMYLGNAVEAQPIAELDGTKFYSHTSGSWRVTDVCVTGEDRSAGTITVSDDGHPVWLLQYGGWYREKAILVLKRALTASYESQAWHGGRGEPLFRYQHWTYVNQVESHIGGFGRGAESIYEGQDCIGEHWYQSFWLALIKF